MINIRKAALFIYIFSIPLEYWNPFNLVGSLSVSRLAGGLYLMTSLFNINKSFSIKETKYFLLPLLALFVSFLTSTIINSFFYPLGDTFFNSSLFQNIIVFWIMTNHLSEDKKLINQSLIAFASGVILLGILYSFGIGLFYRQGRISIFGDNPNNQGTKVAVSILLLLFFSLSNKLNIGKLRFLLLAPLPILLNFLADTGSRGAFLTLIAGLGIFVLLYKTRKRYLKLFAMIIGVALIIVVYNWFMNTELIERRMTEELEDKSLGGRTEIWLNTLDIFEKSPLFGVGEPGFNFEITEKMGTYKSAHNLFLYTLAVSGIIGFSFLIFFMLRLFKMSYFQYRTKSEYVPITLLILTAFAMFRSGGSFGDKSYWYFFAVIAGSSIFAVRQYYENILDEVQ